MQGRIPIVAVWQSHYGLSVTYEDGTHCHVNLNYTY
jgi:hypothetical protein